MDGRSHSLRSRSGSPGRKPVSYEDDLYSWALEQASLLRAGRLAEADVMHIAEELDDVGTEQCDKLESALRLILLHLLKWDHQPQRRSRSWRATILVQRNHVRRLLRKNPGLKAGIEEACADAYSDARIEAAAQTRLDECRFPARCPYSWTDITERAIPWPPA